MTDLNGVRAIEYVQASIEQLDKTKTDFKDTQQRIIGIVDLLAYLKIISLNECMKYRKQILGD
jgi:hypothetical protein